MVLTSPPGVIKSRSRSKAHDTMFNQNPNVLLHTHWTYDKSWQEYYSKMGVTNQISMQSFSENWGLLFNAIHMNVLPLTHKEVTIIKWGASSRWSSSLYCPMRNSDQMAIGKTHPTLEAI